MKIAVASKNPVKIDSARVAFQKVFPDEDIEIKGISVPSDISDQPFGDTQTRTGCINRIKNLEKLERDFDYLVALEGGIEEDQDALFAFGWVYIKSNNTIGKGRTASFYLPPKVSEYVRNGLELGDAVDKVFLDHNSKQKNGASGMLTKDLVKREDLFIPAVIIALIPFINRGLFNNQ